MQRMPRLAALPPLWSATSACLRTPSHSAPRSFGASEPLQCATIVEHCMSFFSPQAHGDSTYHWQWRSICVVYVACCDRFVLSVGTTAFRYKAQAGLNPIRLRLPLRILSLAELHFAAVIAQIFSSSNLNGLHPLAPAQNQSDSVSDNDAA